MYTLPSGVPEMQGCPLLGLSSGHSRKAHTLGIRMLGEWGFLFVLTKSMEERTENSLP